MKIAILGTGHMGQTLARLWSQNGHQIILGSRDPDSVEDLAQQIGVQAQTIAAASEEGEVITLAFPWFAATDVFRNMGELNGKIIVDCLNPLMSSGSLALGHKTSAAEEIQRWAPKAMVIKAFNSIHWQNLSDPNFGGLAADAFYCSNYDQAKAVVAQLASEMGFNPVDCGPLENARLLEPLAVFWIRLAFTGGLGTDFAIKLIHRS